MRRLAPAMAVLALTAGCVTSLSGIESPHFVVNAQGITDEKAHEISREAERRYADLAAFFGRESDEKILIVIRDFDTRRAYANHFENRIEIPIARLGRDNLDSGLTHEITHIITQGPFSGSRLLSEGVAMYAEERFSDELSPAARARIDVHHVVKTHILEPGLLVPISDLYWDDLAFSNNQPGYVATSGRQRAYFEAGSFVRFLIETQGIEKFKQAYYLRPIEKVYGKSLDALEEDWLVAVRAYE